jgi:hypothetical protein
MPRALLAVILAAYAVFLAAYFAPVPAGSDSSGYFNTARLLTEGRLATPLRAIDGFTATSPWMFTPHGFTPDGAQPGLTPTYPTGLPLHYALAGLVAGWTWGPLFVAVLASVAAVLLTYLIARELGVRPALAIVGAATLAISPLFLQVSFIPMSDVPATAWLALAVLGGLRSAQSSRWAVLAGFAFSVAVVIRPTTAVLAPAWALLLGGWRPLGWAWVGALPGAVWQAFTGLTLFGGLLRTGYGAFGESFAWIHFVPSWRNYLATFPWVLPLGILAVLTTPWLPWRNRGRVLAALILMSAGLVLFYAFYNITQETWWYLRFVLPVFPILTALALLGLQGLVPPVGPSGESDGPDSARRPLGGRRAPAWLLPALVLLICAVPALLWGRKQHVLLMKSFQHPYAAAGEWARSNLPTGSAVAAMHLSGTLYFYTDLPIVRWDLITPADVTALRQTLSASGRKLHAMVHPFEGDTQLRERFPWTWEKIAEVEGVAVYRSGGEPR